MGAGRGLFRGVIMFLKVLHSKIHNALVTQADVHYVGSVTVDEELLRAAGISPNEVVLIADLTNGARLETYVIKGPAGSGVVCINGAAAHLIHRGDRVIIFAHRFVQPQELQDHQATVVITDAQNRIAKVLHYPSSLDQDAPMARLNALGEIAN